MLRIGLTGGIGCGKSTVGKMFSKLGVPVIDADKIARELVGVGSVALAEITTHFGPTILDSNGCLNRPALRQRVFNNLEDKAWLENLLHPLIRSQIEKQVKNACYPYCIIDIPLLVENQAFDLIDRTLVVDTTETLQMQRTTRRDKQSEKDVTKILQAQASREDRLSAADDVIENESTFEVLQLQVEQLHHTYLKLANRD